MDRNEYLDVRNNLVQAKTHLGRAMQALKEINHLNPSLPHEKDLMIEAENCHHRISLIGEILGA